MVLVYLPAVLKSNPAAPALGIIESARLMVIGHRGFCQLAPENTLPSFELAIAAGADMVELDYRLSQDGVPVVIHDAELDRTTDARQRWGCRHVRVDARTAREIQGLDAGSWFAARFAGAKVPSLSEALGRLGRRAVPLIEHKAGGAAACVEWLRERRLLNRVIVQSFDWQYLSDFHEREPEQVLGALGPAYRLPGGNRALRISRKLNRGWLDRAAQTGARILVWNRQVGKEAVRLAHERGLKVWAYTINDPRLAHRLLDAGVDGIITNNPPLIRGLAQTRGADESAWPGGR